MEVTAVKDSTYVDLYKHGIRAKGDILALRGYCNTMNLISNISDELAPKKTLLECIKVNRRTNNTKSTVKSKVHVLFMFPVDSQVVPTKNSELREKDSVYDIGDEEADRFFESFREPYGLEKDSIAVDGSCKCNLKKIIQDETEHLQLKVEEAIRVLCLRHPDRFWRILFKQKIDFSVNDTSITWSDEAGADGRGLYREFLLRSMENLLDSTLFFFGKKSSIFQLCTTRYYG